MLNIPEEVKQLFRQGSAKKNLRIHFPNGEREDITNSNLVADSFSFTESICSEDTLKFGLCEASMVEFETFNIGNIKGCTIEITLEVLNGQEWYSIPIGTYVIDSCEKQSNMTRRSVKAYSKEFTFEKMSSLEFGKRATIKSQHATRKYYDYDLFKFIAINYFNGKEDFLSKALVETVNFGVSGTNNQLQSGYSWQITSNCKSYIIQSEDELKALYYINNDYNKSGVVSELKKELYDIVEQWANLYFTGYYHTDYYIREAIKYAYPWISDTSPYGGISIDDDSNYIYMYPYGYEADLEYGYARIWLPYSFQVTLRLDGYEKESYSFKLAENPEIYLVDTSEWKEFLITEKGDFVNKRIDFREITEAYIELMGLFGKNGRNGEFDFISLNSTIGLYPSETLYPSDNLYPTGTDILLTKSMYKTAWYDDEYTRLYSKVICTYKDSETEEDTYAEHIIVEVEEGEEDKYQTYDISDNYLIKENTFTEAQIAEILATLASNIDRVRYMPAEVDLRGLPYLEAGDVVRVLTTDGGFETIILRRTLTGIQALSDNFESRG